MHHKYTSQDIKLMKLVGERVRELRNLKGLSQFQLGLEADLTKNQIGRIERAERNTSLVTLGRIAQALEISLAQLFVFEG
ncbi:MAG: helix-turn-helix transcriptional regulator [Bacteroidota bacterium]